MIKHSIRLTSFVLALFTFILTFQNIMTKQQQLPFGATNQFELNISGTDAPKEKLVEELNEITSKNNAMLVKVITDSDHYENKKDIIWFGEKKPVSKKLIVDDENINWFEPKIRGELISSVDIGSRPLYGMYAMKGSDDFKESINNWAKDNGIIISWVAQPSILKSIYYNLIHGGVGNAIITAFLLLLATLIIWFVNHSKSRVIRLLGGVSTNRINKEDTLLIMKNISYGFLISWIIALVYLALTNRIRQIPLILLPSLIVMSVFLVLVCLLILSISILVKPKIRHFSKRTIPLKKFKKLETATRIFSIILALLIIPSTLTSAYILKQLSKEYSLWEKMQSNVSISFGDLDSLETSKMLPHVEKFFEDMEKKNNLSLSFVIDKSILLNKDEYGGYDNLIITDKSWVDSFNIGIDKEGTGGKLVKKSFDKLEIPLQNFLNVQMPIWTKTGEVQPKGIEFYEFEGSAFLALPPNVGYGGSTIQAKNPLVILVEEPTLSLKINSFILPSASSGNIVFPDEEMLNVALQSSPIKEYVVSVDKITDIALEQAQRFGKEAIFYVLACILIFMSMTLAGIMNAKLWVNSNKKRIFILHTFGKTYNEIIQPAFKRESIIAIITIIFASIISFVIRHPQPIVLVSVAVTVLFLYCIGNLVAYNLCARQAFYKISRRND